jgi:hypothetical protein
MNASIGAFIAQSSSLDRGVVHIGEKPNFLLVLIVRSALSE